jgi:hypothetical protein
MSLKSGFERGSWEILSGDLFGDLWPAAKPSGNVIAGVFGGN